VTESGSGRHAVNLTPMRRAIARRMSDSKREVPHFYLSVEIEMDPLLGALAERNEGRDTESRISVTAAIVHALAHTLVVHPEFNATWRGDVLELVDDVNIGVAIDLPEGLIAPALLGCQERALDSTAEGLRDLVTRARAERLRATEWSDATFTLSNLGMFGIDAFSAIVVPPQVAILATARTSERAVVRDGRIVTRHTMIATLSADHRAVDGANAARFLGTLNELLGAPESWPASDSWQSFMPGGASRRPAPHRPVDGGAQS
jgi:pyruvate dehydrogenase E2 component (dihydrolipoamide acetyltransferase)